ncbi:hypothetical protein OVY29_03750 [Sphingopyxis sp. SE2]|uniref:hypothetical protein n=1 Tax=Sphingopyxis sp. SE2 TaxID=1586240 RepID=UPI0028C3700E|nr:hypothetical protein [Sphingopyxis sp. SE2]MDT7527776.1 hypothetical protein [Sphingopyxis sp. SE2]
MNQPPNEPPRERPLNRGLKSETDASHDLERSPAPIDTTEAREGQGEGWPIVWVVVTVVCVVLAIWFLI